MFNILMESNDNFEDLYEVLEVHMGSTKKEIIEQYKSKLNPFNNKIKNGNHLSEEELWEVKLLKIARYVLTNRELREKYNVSRILNTTEEDESQNNFNYNEPKQESKHNKFLEYETNSVPIRKDQETNYDLLTNRQFERFDHENFDLTKDRMLRSSTDI